LYAIHRTFLDLYSKFIVHHSWYVIGSVELSIYDIVRVALRICQPTFFSILGRRDMGGIGGTRSQDMTCASLFWGAVIKCEVKSCQHFSAFVDVRLKQFYFSAWKFAWNYFEIISEAYSSSWIFFNGHIFTVAV